MRKSALLLAFVFAASAPSLALAKKAHHRAPVAPASVADSGPSDNGHFFHDAFHQIFVPAEQIFSPRAAAPAAAPVRHARHGRRHHA